MVNAESQEWAATKNQEAMERRGTNLGPGEEITRMQKGERDETKDKRGITTIRYFRSF